MPVSQTTLEKANDLAVDYNLPVTVRRVFKELLYDQEWHAKRRSTNNAKVDADEQAQSDLHRQILRNTELEEEIDHVRYVCREQREQIDATMVALNEVSADQGKGKGNQPKDLDFYKLEIENMMLRRQVNTHRYDREILDRRVERTEDDNRALDIKVHRAEDSRKARDKLMKDVEDELQLMKKFIRINKGTCQICMERDINTIFKCAHGTCDGCRDWTSAPTCPFCRGPVDGSVSLRA